MDKRFQVFISSTYEDLKDARQEVSQALLETNCFPAGMELFPAADDEQFEFIKKIIDQSDYYLVISAGKYGSLHPDTGKSYTEMEFEYAQSIGVPIIALLQKYLDELPANKIEKTAKGRKNLENFREKLISRRIVKFWSTPSELGKEVILGLNWAQKHKPATG